MIEKSKEEMIKDIMELTSLHESKIRNIYIYGSRIYGTDTVNSDYDIIVVACSLYVNYELSNGTYNIHITTPDSFQDKLNQHDMHALECIMAPEQAVLMNKIDYSKNFKLNTGMLKKMILSQSTWAWTKAQKRIESGNITGGVKSLFHSLRILNFGLQMLHHGKITNFSASNETWNILKNCDDFEWSPYYDAWCDIRKKLVKIFKYSEKGRVEVFVHSRRLGKEIKPDSELKCCF
jgi:hypothetical protein